MAIDLDPIEDGMMSLLAECKRLRAQVAAWERYAEDEHGIDCSVPCPVCWCVGVHALGCTEADS